MKQPLVFIILLNWNGYKDTIACINRLEKIDYKNYKIILVDNGSSDDSVNILKAKFPQIKIIENQENLGFSGGANIGMKYALKMKADYIMLLNNDVIAKHNFLSELVKTLESNPKIGIASSLISYYYNKDIIQSAGGYINYTGLYPFKDPNHKIKNRGQFKENLFVDALIGCSILIKRKVLEKVGLLDDSYFIYAEDMDLSIRAKNSGFLLSTVVTSNVWHKASASSGGNENSLTYLYYNTRNLIIFSKKNLILKERIVFNAYYLLGRSLDIAKYLSRRQYKACKAILFGLFHGYSGKTGRYQLR